VSGVYTQINIIFKLYMELKNNILKKKVLVAIIVDNLREQNERLVRLSRCSKYYLAAVKEDDVCCCVAVAKEYPTRLVKLY
jgi:hypothetical protein